MSIVQIVFTVLFGGLLVVMAIAKLRQPYRPSRFRQALWADSVRKRGLTTEQALEEYQLMWPDRPADRLVSTCASVGLCPRCLHSAHGDLKECKACYCRSWQ